MNRSLSSRVAFLLLAIALIARAGGVRAGDSPGGADAPEAAKPGAGRELRVVSYNVQFLPGIAALANDRGDAPYRARRIGEELAAFDLVGLQEAFDPAPRELILDGLRAAWGDAFHVVLHEKPGDGRGAGGLLIASRLPILESHSWHFRDLSDFEKPRPDDLVAKGVLHARVALDAGESLDVFVTHLVAGMDMQRPAQFAEMAWFVERQGDPSRPALLLGDMNTDGEASERADPRSRYNLMMALFQDARPGARLLDLWPLLRGDELAGTNNWRDKRDGRKKRIDYVLLLESEEGAGPALEPLSISVEAFEDPKVRTLSDHSAVAAVLRVRD